VRRGEWSRTRGVRCYLVWEGWYTVLKLDGKWFYVFKVKGVLALATKPLGHTLPFEYGFRAEDGGLIIKDGW
jgi:hypothetical protein